MEMPKTDFQEINALVNPMLREAYLLGAKHVLKEFKLYNRDDIKAYLEAMGKCYDKAAHISK